jgi:hypothetical protein
LKPEEVAISHFRGASNEFIIKFTRTGFGTSHEDLLHASKALGRNRQLQVYAKIAAAEVDSEIYFLLRCMVKAGEAENTYTARSGRPAAWLTSPEEEGVSAPYSFSTVMEVRALMGPASRKEETKRMVTSQVGRRKRALTREAVGYGLKEAIREIGMTEDVLRDEARENGAVQGGGIRWKDKADVSIFKGIKLDSVPAWSDYGRGRGAMGGRGVGARGGHGLRGARGDGGGTRAARGRGGRGGGGRGGRGGSGDRGRGSSGDRGRGSSGDRGRGNSDDHGRGGFGNRSRGHGKKTGPFLTGSNVDSDAPAEDRKRKAEEDKVTEEAKKVKLMELASPSSEAGPAPASSSASASTSTSTSTSASTTGPRVGRSLINILMSGQDLAAAKGFKLFD